MTSLTRALLLLALALPACDDPAEPDGRPPVGRYGLVAFNATGFDAFSDTSLPVEHWHEGFAATFIEHPIDDAGQPQPEHLTLALQFGGAFSRVAPAQVWHRPDELHVLIRQRDTVPRGTRTVFTGDMEPPQLRLELDGRGTEPSRRYAGSGRLEVFAADLKTGTAWGRLTAELHAIDSDSDPLVFTAEFAALPGPVLCSWEVPPRSAGGHRDLSEPPEGRADDCTPALQSIMAAEAHPDAPPVPDFQPAFYGLQRPPARWDGLDRDL